MQRFLQRGWHPVAKQDPVDVSKMFGKKHLGCSIKLILTCNVDIDTMAHHGKTKFYGVKESQVTNSQNHLDNTRSNKVTPQNLRKLSKSVNSFCAISNSSNFQLHLQTCQVSPRCASRSSQVATTTSAARPSESPLPQNAHELHQAPHDWSCPGEPSDMALKNISEESSIELTLGTSKSSFFHSMNLCWFQLQMNIYHSITLS